MNPDPRHSSESWSAAVLSRYPVKSMMGQALNAAEVTERGPAGDRQFALVTRRPERSRAPKTPALLDPEQPTSRATRLTANRE
jgi:hypothetical protein